MPEYVLIAPIATKKCGKPIAFASYTGIGPATSADPQKWRRFASPDDARRSPANAHPLAVFDVVDLAEVDHAGS